MTNKEERAALLIVVLFAASAVLCVVIGYEAINRSAVAAKEELATATHTPLPYTDFIKGYISGYTDETTLVIRDEAVYLWMWDHHTRFVWPSPPPPFVDFEKDILVACFMGQWATSGYEIWVQRVDIVKDFRGVRVEVFVRYYMYPRFKMVKPEFSAPVHVIRLPIPRYRGSELDVHVIKVGAFRTE